MTQPLQPNRARSAPTLAEWPPARTDGEVRPLAPGDIDGIVALHRLAFGAGRPRVELQSFLSEVFFAHPWADEAFPSLGWFARDGTLAGCVGVMPRPMMIGSQPVRAVVTHNFMVHPQHRTSLAAIRLEKALIERGPELVMSEGNDAARRIISSMGGMVVQARSDRWLRFLRPAALLAHLAASHSAPPLLTRILTTLAILPDACATAIPCTPVRLPRVDGPDTWLESGAWTEMLQRHVRGCSLRPVYTEASLRWLMTTLGKTRRDQRLRAAAVHDHGEAVGWYVYYSRPGGIGRVLQTGADGDSQQRVLDHLFADAHREHNVALSGQADPAWTESLRGRGCFFRTGRSWFLTYTTLPAVRRVLAEPHAFLSRLEGEGWLRFAF